MVAGPHPDVRRGHHEIPSPIVHSFVNPVRRGVHPAPDNFGGCPKQLSSERVRLNPRVLGDEIGVTGPDHNRSLRRGVRMGVQGPPKNCRAIGRSPPRKIRETHSNRNDVPPNNNRSLLGRFHRAVKNEVSIGEFRNYSATKSRIFSRTCRGKERSFRDIMVRNRVVAPGIAADKRCSGVKRTRIFSETRLR